jgi:ADP-ribose pyrophosphatase
MAPGTGGALVLPGSWFFIRPEEFSFSCGLSGHTVGGLGAIPGGALKLGEAAVDAAFRESHEEAGVPKDQVRVLGTSVLDLGFWSYTTVLGVADNYFEPVVGDLESAALEWVPMNDVLGRDLHPSFGRAWPDLRDRLLAHQSDQHQG